VELPNVTCLDLEELQMQLHLAIARLRQKVDIVRSFFAGPDYHSETSDLCATLSNCPPFCGASTAPGYF
jgi:hypothetical protein